MNIYISYVLEVNELSPLAVSVFTKALLKIAPFYAYKHEYFNHLDCFSTREWLLTNYFLKHTIYSLRFDQLSNRYGSKRNSLVSLSST